MSPEMLHKWIRQAAVDEGQAPGVTTEAVREIRELRHKGQRARAHHRSLNSDIQHDDGKTGLRGLRNRSSPGQRLSTGAAGGRFRLGGCPRLAGGIFRDRLPATMLW